MYRVKNITDRLFNFEGTVIEPGQVSKELSLDTFQRLMALNYGTALMPVEDGELAEEVIPEPPAVGVPIVEEPEPVITTETFNPEAVSETETVEETVEVQEVTEVQEEPEPAVAEEPVEVPKKRGRPRRNL